MVFWIRSWWQHEQAITLLSMKILILGQRSRNSTNKSPSSTTMTWTTNDTDTWKGHIRTRFIGKNIAALEDHLCTRRPTSNKPGRWVYVTTNMSNKTDRISMIEKHEPWHGVDHRPHEHMDGARRRSWPMQRMHTIEPTRNIGTHYRKRRCVNINANTIATNFKTQPWPHKTMNRADHEHNPSNNDGGMTLKTKPANINWRAYKTPNLRVMLGNNAATTGSKFNTVKSLFSASWVIGESWWNLPTKRLYIKRKEAQLIIPANKISFELGFLIFNWQTRWNYWVLNGRWVLISGTASCSIVLLTMYLYQRPTTKCRRT